MARPYDPEVEGQYQALVAGGATRRQWHLNKLRLVELVGMAQHDRVLDAGCGAGNLVVALAPLGRTVVGCDTHHGRLTFAAHRGAGRYVEATIEALPFADRVFDTIVCLEVLEHVEPRATPRILDEFHRVLKSKGQLLITTPNYRSLWPVIEFCLHTLRLVPRIPGGDHICKYHWDALRRILTAARFTVRQMGSFNHISPFLAPLSARWAERAYRWELQTSRAGGPLLFALGEKA